MWQWYVLLYYSIYLLHILPSVESVSCLYYKEILLVDRGQFHSSQTGSRIRIHPLHCLID